MPCDLPWLSKQNPSLASAFMALHSLKRLMSGFSRGMEQVASGELGLAAGVAGGLVGGGVVAWLGVPGQKQKW